LLDRPNSPQSVILAGQMTDLDPRNELLLHQMGNQVLGSGFLSRLQHGAAREQALVVRRGGGFNWLEHAVPYVINAPVQADRTGRFDQGHPGAGQAFLSTSGVTRAELVREINGTTRELPGASRPRARCSARCCRTTSGAGPTTSTTASRRSTGR
jgi:hypothetical protein